MRRGHDHVAELRHQQTGADSEQREGDLEARLVQFDVDRADEDESRDHHCRETDLHYEPWRKTGRELRAGERCDEHRDRHRQQSYAGLERVELQDDLEVDRQDEEGAHQHELLGHERRQTGAEGADAQQRAFQQGV
jgi:hypothetical protein